MHKFRTQCPYNLNIAILKNTHAMTTQTTAVGDSYLLVVQHRELERLQGYDCPLRRCAPLADLPGALTVHCRGSHSTTLSANSRAIHWKSAWQPKPNRQKLSDLCYSQLSIHETTGTPHPTSTSALPTTSAATLHDDLLT